MGNTSSDFKNAELSSFPERLEVFGSRYCSKRVVSMTTIEELSFSGDNFRIVDADDNLIYQMEGRVFSWRSKKKLYDNENNPVASIKHKMASFRHQLNIFDKNNSRVAVVRTASLVQFSPKLKVWLRGKDAEVNYNRPPDIIITGNCLTDNIIFTNSSCQVIAKVRRKAMNLRNFLGKQTYECTVAPNIDNSFIAVLIVCIDEIYAEGSAN